MDTPGGQYTLDHDGWTRMFRNRRAEVMVMAEMGEQKLVAILVSFPNNTATVWEVWTHDFSGQEPPKQEYKGFSQRRASEYWVRRVHEAMDTLWVQSLDPVVRTTSYKEGYEQAMKDLTAE